MITDANYCTGNIITKMLTTAGSRFVYGNNLANLPYQPYLPYEPI
jgi:hypothetical protein